MAAGLKVWSQDGSGALQIDDTHQNLFLRAKGRATSTFRPSPSYDYSTVSGIMVAGVQLFSPVVVISALQLSQCVPVNRGSGNVELQFSMNSGVGSVADWWLFDTLAPAEKSSSGLLVWNAAGQLQYDVLKKPLRVVGVSRGASASATYPAGRSYAGMVSGGGGTRAIPGTDIPGQPPSPAGYVILTGGVMVSGTTVTAASYQVFGGQGSSLNAQYDVSFLAADVTNY
jgi:hypothetical protein